MAEKTAVEITIPEEVLGKSHYIGVEQYSSQY